MNSTASSWLKTLSYTVRAVCLVHIIHTHFYEFTETRGESMLPTLSATNDYIHAIKKYKDGKGLKIGDCIVTVKPTDPSQRVCKRITGMPGDVILVDPSMGFRQITDHNKNQEFNDNKILDSIDNNECNETFNSFIKVPNGHVWVTGDNLSHSLDSRTYNSLPMGLIKGKIVAANDFNEPFWGGSKGNFWGFRRIENTFVEEKN